MEHKVVGGSRKKGAGGVVAFSAGAVPAIGIIANAAVGSSASAIVGTLASAGAVVGGGMAAGLVAFSVAPLAAGAATYGVYKGYLKNRKARAK